MLGPTPGMRRLRHELRRDLGEGGDVQNPLDRRRMLGILLRDDLEPERTRALLRGRPPRRRDLQLNRAERRRPELKRRRNDLRPGRRVPQDLEGELVHDLAVVPDPDLAGRLLPGTTSSADGRGEAEAPIERP